MNPDHVLIGLSKGQYLEWYKSTYGHEFGEEETKTDENDEKEEKDGKSGGFAALKKQNFDTWVANQPKTWDDVNTDTFNQIEGGV